MFMNQSMTGNAYVARGQLRTIIIKKFRQFESIAFITVALFGPAHAIAGETHQYTVEVDAALSRMQVVARFSTAVTRVAARSDNAAKFLVAAEDCDRGGKIETSKRRMRLPQAGISCLSYTVDLDKAARADQRNRYLDDSNIVISPTVWMWRPRLSEQDEIRVRIRQPDGVQVSVPWPEIPTEEHAFRLTA